LLESLNSLYSTAYRLIGKRELAEDLVQETARRALSAVPALKNERNVRGWLFAILINLVRDHARRREWEELDTDSEDFEAVPDTVSLSRAAVQDVRRALLQLSPPRRSVVVLVDLEEFTLAEAADMLRLPIGTVASRLARARYELREFLQAYKSEAGGRS
jgi:RNA polymerase sigma-70 factor (ECF subfamily)